MSANVKRAGFAVLIGTVAIFTHELGHAIAAKRLGRKDIQIVLHGLGGMTQYAESTPTRSERVSESQF